MDGKIREIEEDLEKELDGEIGLSKLEEIRVGYLGKKGKVTMLFAGLREVANEKKREVGAKINELKNKVESKIASLKEKLEKEKVEREIKSSFIDITMPVDEKHGSLHPRTIIQKEIEDIFISMGFTIEAGDEIQTEYSCFDAVNMPASHPARDSQDTFWLTNGEVLRTHTSSLQNQVLKKYNGPLKAIFPGRCFRNEALDASHENTFFQIEGMVVGKDLSVSNLIFFMKEMLSKVFKKEVTVRLRPGFFPFTEPSFELDVLCPFCDGEGCSVCKGGKWIELCPCGMIHPNVLREGGVDPEEYNGFAFGLGFDRLVMIRSKINDIRHLNGGDVRILNKFGIDM